MTRPVPHGWKDSVFKEVVSDIGDGGTPDRSKPVNFGGNIPWVVIDDIAPSIISTKEYLSEEGLKRSSAKIWPKGSIILSTGATLGLVGIAYIPLATKQGICGIILEKQKANTEFIYFYLQSMKDYIKSKAQGSSIKEFRPPQVLKMPILLPSLPEQEGIAAVLGSVDATIDATKQVIAQTRQLKRALMQAMLTRGLPGQHTHFKSSPLGTIPANWEVVKLGEVLREPIRNGYSPNCPDNETGHWILGLGAVSQNGFNPSAIKPAPENDLKIHDYLLESGDLLVSRSNTRDKVGLCGIYQGIPSLCSYPDLLMRVRPNTQIVQDRWLEIQLLSPQGRRYFEQEARGTSGSMVKIDRTLLERFPVIKCSVSEQEAIVGILNTVDARLAQENETLTRLQTLKTALMQVLLTGEVRVPFALGVSPPAEHSEVAPIAVREFARQGATQKRGTALQKIL